jgi:hypothetical protein
MARSLPLLAFVLSAAVLAFLGGVVVADRGLFPYPQLRDGLKTIQFTLRQIFSAPFYGNFAAQPENGSLDGLAARRFRPLGETLPKETLIVSGGLNQYLDVCPGYGCIAIEIDRSGAVLRGVPFRPAEILAADMTGGVFIREGVDAPPERLIRPIGVAPYPDGDLLVTFQSIGDNGSFPFSMGVGRIDPEGRPRWFRFDFSHHWSMVLPDGGALVPALEVATQDMRTKDGNEEEVIECETDRPQIDYVQRLDAAGAVVARYDIAAQLSASNWSMAVVETIDDCDPLHINYIDLVGPDDAPDAGLSEGDLILSLRNISAVAVLDGATGTLKNLIRGDFAQQHAVQHLGGSKLLMFDNWGGDRSGGPSRLLEVDAATGASRRIFPVGGLFEGAPVYSRVAGHLDISPDRRRAVVAFSNAGRAFEVDLATGEALMAFEGLHDISDGRNAPRAFDDRPARGEIYSVEYFDPRGGPAAASLAKE